MQTNELYHHGIKGMKWGVRRTPEQLGHAPKRKRPDIRSEDRKNADAARKKKLKSLSNAELRQLNERERLEQEYKRLRPSAVNKGKKFVVGAVAVTGTALTLYNNGDKIFKLGKGFVDKVTKR